MPSFEEQYQSQLRSIELAIVQYYNEYPDMVDHNVDKVLEGLIRTYDKRKKDRKPPKLRFKGVEESLHATLFNLSEVMLGELDPNEAGMDVINREGDVIDTVVEDEAEADEMLEELEDDEEEVVVLPTISLDEMINVLKRLRNSIAFWGSKQGRTGYLDYINGFMNWGDEH